MSLFSLKNCWALEDVDQNCYLCVNFQSDTKLSKSQCLHLMFYVSLHFSTVYGAVILAHL